MAPKPAATATTLSKTFQKSGQLKSMLGYASTNKVFGLNRIPLIALLLLESLSGYKFQPLQL
ncbi:hypothetical protein OAF27_00355 [Verrucomicrobiales bacterium]|nr:hypothetical protein [Verrucomicrobiales bacterium]